MILHRTRELDALNRIGTATSGSLTLTEVLDQALDATLAVLDLQAGEIFLLEEEKGEVVLARHRGLVPEAFREIPRFKLGEGFPGRVAQTGEALVTSKLAKDLRFLRKQVLEAGFTTFASVPLKAKGKVVGTLDVAALGRRAFTEGDLSLLTTIGAVIGMAVANSRLYEELRLAAIHLEAKVEDRTRELQVALRRAKEASRHKSEFLANMSHELRTPLNSIIGFSEILEDQTFGPLNEKQACYAQNILVSGRHLLALISDILDLSKVEAGKIELHAEPFALREALEAALTNIRPQADAKGLTLALHGDEALSLLTADPIRFKQILYNLLSNAVKFTPSGGSVTVSARVRSEEVGVRGQEQTPYLSPLTPHWVEISVADTGIGIKAEDLPKLFQPFTQLEPVYSKEYQGTGLGLALTKRLVELHGGQIRADSDGEGKGSTFTMRLPLTSPMRPEGA